MKKQNEPVAGKVFINWGPLLVRRGFMIPQFIMYIWAGVPIVESGPRAVYIHLPRLELSLNIFDNGWINLTIEAK